MPNNDQLISYMLWVFNNPDAAQVSLCLLGMKQIRKPMAGNSASRVH